MPNFIQLSPEHTAESAITAEIADNFLRRFLGLMGRPSLPQGHGLLLTSCSSIHMMFMRFAIDAVYLDKDFHILKITECLQPWLGLSCCPGAWACLELPAGEAGHLGLTKGQRLVPCQS